jgi:hypothetical protein
MTIRAEPLSAYFGPSVAVSSISLKPAVQHALYGTASARKAGAVCWRDFCLQEISTLRIAEMVPAPSDGTGSGLDGR